MERRTFLQTSVAVAAVSGLAGLGALPTLAMPFEKKRKRVMGHDIAYIDEGAGRPVVTFTVIQLHPTYGATSFPMSPTPIAPSRPI